MDSSASPMAFLASASVTAFDSTIGVRAATIRSGINANVGALLSTALLIVGCPYIIFRTSAIAFGIAVQFSRSGKIEF